ncbi:MAG: class I SAM-dependent methyltransferase [Cyanobacteria bacterium]|nr:class I SAM-dependent methyltransferase [Cyanobacteriota bacterium]
MISKGSSDSISNSQLSHFFNGLSHTYDEAIFRGCPPYLEMLEALFRFSKFYGAPEKPYSILELGCGTGNVSCLIQKTFPNAQLTLVDFSQEMLDEAQGKWRALFSTEKNPVALMPSPLYLAQDFMSLDFEPGAFDLIVSSLALHHLKDEEKPVLYQRLYHWLKLGGEFRCADQCLGLPASGVHLKFTEDWKAWASSKGATDSEMKMWTDHSMEWDHYAPVSSHFQWLSEAGFADIDCYWKKLFWTVLGGQKPV